MQCVPLTSQHQTAARPISHNNSFETKLQGCFELATCSLWCLWLAAQNPSPRPVPDVPDRLLVD